MADLIERDAAIDCLDSNTFDGYENAVMTLHKIEDIPPVNRQISVEDALPEANTQVICYCRLGDFRIMEYDEQDGRWYEGIHDYRKQAVTHWMPLPEPPEKE